MNLLCFMISIIFVAMSIIFIRNRRLEFKSGLLWIFISFILMIFSINSAIVEYFAKAVGIVYAPAFLFLMGIAFSLIMIFYLMVVVSKMEKKLTKLVQENSILKDRIGEK